MATTNILFCWEYGGGLGHISSLHAIAETLAKPEFRCVLVNPGNLNNPTRYPGFDEIIEFPNAFDLLPDHSSKREKAVSYNATIKAFGFDNPKFVFTRLKLWQQLYDKFEPDLVIGDYAPMALLAARKSGIPTLATGNGYTLPPINVRTYPKFVNQPDPVSAEQILKSTNQALRLADMGQISTVPEIFKSDIHACCTNPMLDPFRKIRKPAAIGALLESIPEFEPDTSDKRIFIYLTNCRASVSELVLEAAKSTSLEMHVYSLQVTDTMRELVKGSRLTIVEEPLPIASICKNYALVIHLGGHNLMMELLEAGRPQLLLPVDMEKILHAQGMENLNFAHQLRLDHPKPASVLAAKILDALADQTIADNLKQYVSRRTGMNHDECLQFVRRSVEQLLSGHHSGSR